MVKKFKRIGVLTSGGDAPGMNAAVRAVTRAGLIKGVNIMGIYEGYKGLIDSNLKRFQNRDVSNIINHGGTVLYSARCDEFKEEPGMQKAIETCHKNKIDGIITIGGDGTFKGAMDLTKRGIPCIGIPGTIDNDITSTDHSIGFDTAMNTVIQMVDRLRDTCESHARCNVVEVMGRDAGYIALYTGIAVGASAIVTLEVPFDEKAAIEKIKKAKEKGKRNFIVIIAEGVPIELKEKWIKDNQDKWLEENRDKWTPETKEKWIKDNKDEWVEDNYKEKYSEKLARRIEKATEIETKFARLAHVVRGGSPTVRDRVLAAQMGYKAVELLLAGKSNLVVCERKGEIVPMDISEALVLDRMYKNKLKDGDLKDYLPEQIEEMKEFCKAKRQEFLDMYKMADELSH